MKVYAFEWCCCIYESSYATVSLHRTLKGARQAMRKRLWDEWVEGDSPYHGCTGYEGRWSRQRMKPLSHERWRVVPVAVLDD